MNLVVECSMIKLSDLDIKQLSETIKIDLGEDVVKYISDISVLLSIIPNRLDHLELEYEEEIINSPNATQISEIAQEDLGSQEGNYFVSKRAVS